jgi:hypothetical protein
LSELPTDQVIHRASNANRRGSPIHE